MAIYTGRASAWRTSAVSFSLFGVAVACLIVVYDIVIAVAKPVLRSGGSVEIAYTIVYIVRVLAVTKQWNAYTAAACPAVFSFIQLILQVKNELHLFAADSQ